MNNDNNKEESKESKPNFMLGVNAALCVATCIVVFALYVGNLLNVLDSAEKNVALDPHTQLRFWLACPALVLFALLTGFSAYQIAEKEDK